MSIHSAQPTAASTSPWQRDAGHRAGWATRSRRSRSSSECPFLRSLRTFVVRSCLTALGRLVPASRNYRRRHLYSFLFRYSTNSFPRSLRGDSLLTDGRIPASDIRVSLTTTPVAADDYVCNGDHSATILNFHFSVLRDYFRKLTAPAEANGLASL